MVESCWTFCSEAENEVRVWDIASAYPWVIIFTAVSTKASTSAVRIAVRVCHYFQPVVCSGTHLVIEHNYRILYRKCLGTVTKDIYTKILRKLYIT